MNCKITICKKFVGGIFDESKTFRIYIYIYINIEQLINFAARLIYNLKKKRCFFTSILYLQLALATHARFKYALYCKRDSLGRHQATQPCKRTIYIYLVLSFDF